MRPLPLPLRETKAQRMGHAEQEEKSKPAPLKTKGCGTRATPKSREILRCAQNDRKTNATLPHPLRETKAQRMGHAEQEEKSKPAPLKTKGCGTRATPKSREILRCAQNDRKKQRRDPSGWAGDSAGEEVRASGGILRLAALAQDDSKTNGTPSPPFAKAAKDGPPQRRNADATAKQAATQVTPKP
jgi:hypothetical protein